MRAQCKCKQELQVLLLDDGCPRKIEKVIDIRRIDKDGNEYGEHLAVKKVKRGSQEIANAKMLTTRKMLEDPMNHCVPILDHFSDTKDTDLEYIVMPLLRKFDDPAFYSIYEATDFIRQILEVSKIKHIMSL